MEAVLSFSSQFYDEKTDKGMSESPIAFKGFLDMFKSRSDTMDEKQTLKRQKALQ